MKLRHRILSVIFFGLAVCVSFSVAVPSPAFAIQILGKDLSCNPAAAPNAGGCGFTHFIELLKYVIDRVALFTISVAVIVIIAGGFVIMTAGGSEEKFKKGKNIILAAVIGVVIALAAWLIITGLYSVLGLSPQGQQLLPR